MWAAIAAHWLQFASDRTKSEPNAATIMVAEKVFSEVILGKIDTSMARKPDTPCTLS